MSKNLEKKKCTQTTHYANNEVSVGWYGAETDDTAHCVHQKTSTTCENKNKINVYPK